MKNPELNRFIGYVILFIGIWLFCYGMYYLDMKDDILSTILILLGSLSVIVISIVWMVKRVRCPHCNRMLYLKLWNIDKCPYCKRKTKIK